MRLHWSMEHHKPFSKKDHVKMTSKTTTYDISQNGETNWQSLKTLLRTVKKTDKTWRHQSERLGNKQIIVWFCRKLKRYLNKEAKLRKWYRIVKHKKLIKITTERENLKNFYFVWIFFWKKIIEMVIKTFKYTSKLVFEFIYISIFGEWELLLPNVWHTTPKTNKYSAKKTNNYFKRTGLQKQ